MPCVTEIARKPSSTTSLLDQLVAFEGLTIQARRLEDQQHRRVTILQNQQHAIQTFATSPVTALRFIDAHELRRAVDALGGRVLDAGPHLVGRAVLPLRTEATVNRADIESLSQRPGDPLVKRSGGIETGEVDVGLFGGLLPPLVNVAGEFLIGSARIRKLKSHD